MTTQARREIDDTWLRVLKRYFTVLLAGNLVWEFAQLPLYTLWYEGPWNKIVFAAVHCTGGDLLIAGSAFFMTLFFVANRGWPYASYGRVAIVAGAAGLAIAAQNAKDGIAMPKADRGRIRAGLS